MKLITKAIAAAAPAIGTTDALDPREVKVVAKFFTPWSNWTWYMTEYAPETGGAFGLVSGFEAELGYFTIAELEEITGPFGLTIERDLHFTGTLDSALRYHGKESLADALIEGAKAIA